MCWGERGIEVVKGMIMGSEMRRDGHRCRGVFQKNGLLITRAAALVFLPRLDDGGRVGAPMADLSDWEAVERLSDVVVGEVVAF